GLHVASGCKIVTVLRSTLRFFVTLLLFMVALLWVDSLFNQIMVARRGHRGNSLASEKSDSRCDQQTNRLVQAIHLVSAPHP
ncbi:MAG TPA: hypothetical protein VGC86_07225, partial [Afipia sp.]